jgi:ArsR family transcriptional regulator, arsenate/arsenite/antimonite-responsive transcriptional repressor
MSLARVLEVQPLARMFKALGDDTRLRIVALLSHGELCVCHLESALGLSQPNISRLLGVLRAAGVVEPRRSGNWVYYRLAPQLDEFCKAHLKSLRSSLAKNGVLKKDIERLIKTRGPGACK